ncbi:serine/arginine repetitive matrix protein 2-like [Pecten maximus]|uniref:serine/arginine repetitive matrix protein 2-like n=1 Tax=Pecten maximus TaxID=6579 RepID=UPI001458915A|nr:serine/arginine repetitive matrix protein 2-like [Pecten maximus]
MTKRIDHRILQSSSLYAPSSGLTNSHVQQIQSHEGQSSRSLNDMGSDRPHAVPQFRHHAQFHSERPGQALGTQNRGPLITEEDLQRYNVNFTDPGAYQRYQQVLARENSTGETYAKFSSDPYHGQTVQQEPPIELVDSIYNRVLRNEDPRHRNQMPQGAFEGSYLDARNDSNADLRNEDPHHRNHMPQGAFEGSYLDARNDSNADLTETEKALLSRIYKEYGAAHLSAGVPQWSTSLTNGHSVPSSNEVSMSTPSSGPIPTFKTLQEQQTSWMQMFQTLEERHEQEMKHQLRQHKDTIFNIQQRMENELFDQQQQLKHKLKVHKKALEDSSFNSTAESQTPDTYRGEVRSPYISPRQNTDKSPRQAQNRDSTRNPREHSPSWREIYQEVRQSLEDHPPVRRSLDGEFTLAPRESPSQRAHSSPPTLTTPPRTRSPERPRSPRPKSPPRSRLQRSKSPPMSRSSRARSPPRSRSPEMRSPPRSRSPKARSRSPKAVSPPRARSRSPPVSRSYLERMTGDAGEVPPRAGVYSSPMPIRRGKGSQSKVSPSAKPRTPPRNKEIYPLIVSPSMSEKRQSSVLQRELEDRHRERVEQQESFNSELYSSATLSDDVHLSSSTRVGLREKHAKHMADLREYYEKELQGLRQALRASDSDTAIGHKSLQHFVSENESLHHEIGLQREKVSELEDKLSLSDRRNYDIEQKVKALEARAAEYADFYKEAQDKISTFRSTVEELQYRIGEKDDLLEQLRAENNAHKNNLKKAKKVQEDQATYIHRDRTALEKLVEQFQANERERSILKESVNDLENKLYDARTENVEMKRTITKLELENRRLGRENDNLHHKISQGISHTISGSIYNSLNESLAVQQEALALDHRHPSPARPASKPTPTQTNHASSRHHTDHTSSRLHPQSDSHSPTRSQPVSAPYVDNSGLNNSVHQSQENVLNGSFHRSEDTLLVRTPPRSTRSRSQLEREDDLIPVTSPIMRAEEELYRLRDVLRNSPTPSREPAQPKLQKKKFYGSDVVTQSRRADMSPDRRSDNLKLKKKSTPSSPLVKSSKHSKLEPPHSKSRSSRKTTQTLVKDQNGKEDFSSQTRFDVNADNQVPRSPGDGQHNGVVWTNKKPPGGDNSSVTHNEDRKKKKEAVEPTMTVDQMLDRVRAGDYLSRPDWEDKYTSMASKPKASPASPRQPTSREDRIKERLRSIGDLEHRYDDLNTEKRQLESALSRLPSHGKSRKKKEEIEDNLDRVERELGSVRMSLKRYNVLKSTI